MKLKTALILLISLVIKLQAQPAYHNADQFTLLGKTSDETETRYERLPAYLKDISRPPVWNLGKNTSGLAIRFRTNSSSISAKWVVTNNNHMNHMTDTGTKGLDLYAWEDDQWQFVNAGLPTGKENERTLISNMTPAEREYMLFLPLYDGIESIEIGIDSAAYIENASLPYPKTEAPVVVYGTSITQGGCATRPGMSYTNILTRSLNREFINLGFSGNGQLDYEIAELMSTRKDAGMFILDFIPNVNAEQIKKKTRNFFDIIRKENPNTPILFIETIMFPHSKFDTKTNEIISEKNRLLREEYDRIKKEGDNNVYYLATDNIIGVDGEATVDGIHMTDLGFLRIAKEIQKRIIPILN